MAPPSEQYGLFFYPTLILRGNTCTVITAQLVGTWHGVCTQKAVLSGLNQTNSTKKVEVISYPPPGSPAKCAPKVRQWPY